MLLPYKEGTPKTRLHVISFLLICFNSLIFLYQIFGDIGFEHFIRQFGLIPEEIRIGNNLADSDWINPYLSIVTSIFVHGDIIHLTFNMIFLWIFGNNVEEQMSAMGFILFYLLIGSISSIAFVLKTPFYLSPLIGASGAISGILGAYLMIFPFSRIYVWIFFFVTIRMPAIFFLAIWFLLQIFGFMGDDMNDGGVAWISHISGFISGMLLYRFFIIKRR